MGRAIVRSVNTAPGAELQLVVLAPARRSCVAVDLASSAVVRVHHPRQAAVTPLSVVEVTVGETVADRLDQPEALHAAHPLRPIGRLLGMRYERLLRSIESEANHSALGIVGPGLPMWELDGSRPSVEILRLPPSTSITVDDRGVRSRFRWGHGAEDLPIEDPQLLRRLDWLPSGRMSLPSLAPVLGFRPSRVAVALSRPKQGYCYKVVAGLLP